MKKLKLYIDSSIDYQILRLKISFMNRYKLQHEIVDINQSETLSPIQRLLSY